MPVNFTLQYDELSNDVDDTTSDIDTVAVSGRIRLTPVFDDGARIPAPFYDPRPTGFYLRVFTGWLDTDGRLKNTPGGDAGMRVWANDPDFGLSELQYLVEAKLLDPQGREVPFAPFALDAPMTDTTVYLSLEMPPPGSDYVRGRAAYDIVDLSITGDNKFQFRRADDVILGPVVANASAEVLPRAHNRAVAFAIALD